MCSVEGEVLRLLFLQFLFWLKPVYIGHYTRYLREGNVENEKKLGEM